MNIWIMTTEDDNGLSSTPYTNKAEAHHAAWEWVEKRWKTEAPDERMPEDWQTAYDHLIDRGCLIDSMYLNGHEVHYTPSSLDKSYILKAKTDGGPCEVFQDAEVRFDEEGGAYVQGWIWVSDQRISTRDLMKKHGYRITSAEEFVAEASREVINEVVAGAGKLDNMVLWADDPGPFNITLPTIEMLEEDFKEHFNG